MHIKRMSEREKSVELNEFDELDYINDMYVQSRQ